MEWHVVTERGHVIVRDREEAHMLSGQLNVLTGVDHGWGTCESTIGRGCWQREMLGRQQREYAGSPETRRFTAD